MHLRFLKYGLIRHQHLVCGNYIIYSCTKKVNSGLFCLLYHVKLWKLYSLQGLDNDDNSSVSGQGSQEPGMGGGLFDRFPKLVAQADEILGYSVKALCNDETDQLNQTLYTQPALFVVSCLSFEAWQEDSGLEISFGCWALGW